METFVGWPGADVGFPDSINRVSEDYLLYVKHILNVSVEFFLYMNHFLQYSIILLVNAAVLN